MGSWILLGWTLAPAAMILALFFSVFAIAVRNERRRADRARELRRTAIFSLPDRR